MKKISIIPVCLIVGVASTLGFDMKSAATEDYYRLLRPPFTEGPQSEIENLCWDDQISCAENITNPSAPQLLWNPPSFKY